MKSWNKYVEEKSLFTNVKKNDVKKQIKHVMDWLNDNYNEVSTALNYHYSKNDEYQMKNTSWYKEFSKSKSKMDKESFWLLEKILKFIEKKNNSLFDLAYEMIHLKSFDQFSKKYNIEEKVYNDINEFFGTVPVENVSTRMLMWSIRVKDGKFLRIMKHLPVKDMEENDDVLDQLKDRLKGAKIDNAKLKDTLKNAKKEYNKLKKEDTPKKQCSFDLTRFDNVNAFEGLLKLINASKKPYLNKYQFKDNKKTYHGSNFQWKGKNIIITTSHDAMKDDGDMGYVGLEGDSVIVAKVVKYIKTYASWKDFNPNEREYI